jgi:hypothetical protein
MKVNTLILYVTPTTPGQYRRSRAILHKNPLRHTFSRSACLYTIGDFELIRYHARCPETKRDSTVTKKGAQQCPYSAT